jgi:hypothetical protein
MSPQHVCQPGCVHGHVPVQITLTVPEQRKLMEAEAGEPCFRMWLTRHEFSKASFADWTAYPISTDHVAIWRKESDLRALLASKDSASRELGMMLDSRRLPD